MNNLSGLHQLLHQQKIFKESTIQPISTKLTITSHFKSLNIKKIMTHDIVNPDPSLGQA